MFAQKQIAVKLRFRLGVKIEIIDRYRILTNSIIENMLNNAMVSFNLQLKIRQRAVFILNFQAQLPGSLVCFSLGMQNDFFKGFGDKVISATCQTPDQALFIVETGDKQYR